MRTFTVETLGFRLTPGWLKRRRRFKEANGFCTRCESPVFQDYRRDNSLVYCSDLCKHLGPHISGHQSVKIS